MTRWIVGLLALVGACAIAAAATLWLSARPVLEQARAGYASLPLESQCERAPNAYPSDHPRSFRALQSDRDVELGVYRHACAAAGLGRSCAYVTGGLRQLGFSIYRGAYLSQCEMRAVNMHGDTPLHAALQYLYPDRAAASLSERELTCVAIAARAGVRQVCRIEAACCPNSGVSDTTETPR